MSVVVTNVLVSSALNTFYLRSNGVGHIDKDHRDYERGNRLLPLDGLLFLISSMGRFVCPCVCVTLAGMRNSSVGRLRPIAAMSVCTRSKCSSSEPRPVPWSVTQRTNQSF